MLTFSPFLVGIDQPLEAVTNLNISYNDLTNVFQVTWEDALNINDTDLGYQIQYSFVALDTVLDTITVPLQSRNFVYNISAGIFSEDGVSINVTVQACNSFSLGEPSSIMLENMEGRIYTVYDKLLYVCCCVLLVLINKQSRCQYLLNRINLFVFIKN